MLFGNGSTIRALSALDRIALQSLIDICEYGGPNSLSYCTTDLGDGFFVLRTRRKGGLDLGAVFCRGPFSNSEITFLAGALAVGRNRLKPHYVKGIAEENLEALRKEPGRRRRESVT